MNDQNQTGIDGAGSKDAVPSGSDSGKTQSAHAPQSTRADNVDALGSGVGTESGSHAQLAAPSTGSSQSRTNRSVASRVERLSPWIWFFRFAAKAMGAVVVAGLVLWLVGLAQRMGWVMPDGVSQHSTNTDLASQNESAAGQKRFICPMKCTPPLTEPGRCPVCGMELVELTSAGGGDGVSVLIEPSARRLIGIQTAVSKLGELTRTIRTIGSIEFDESRLSTISAYIDGRMEKMYADYVGVEVSKNDDLALIYSPQLYTAQTEYVTSLVGSKSTRFPIGDSNLAEMARENLSELGMTEEQINELAQGGKPQSRIRIKSPQAGTVIEKTAVEGDYVKTGQKLYRIADLSSVWLMLDLFPDEAATVRFGQLVEAEIQSLPGEVFQGRVSFIDPTVNRRTRTVRVRVEIMNTTGRLRPGDFATARIAVPAIATELVYDPALAGKYISPMHPQIIRDEPGNCPYCDMELIPTRELGFSAEPLPEQEVVTVPRDAVLLTGSSAVIYVETEPGRFEIRRVTVGPMTDREVIVLDGLDAGETIAIQGNFLIDSQMQLAGNASLMDPTRASSYSSRPLRLSMGKTVMLSREAAQVIDSAYDAYFEIQRGLAEDKPPPPELLKKLLDSLDRSEVLPELPADAKQQFASSRRAVLRMAGSIESARDAFRSVSHGMLRAAVMARSPNTASTLKHYFCPMVPGGGGDWMQIGGELANPYWGAKMLRCGEVVGDLAIVDANAATPKSERAN
ncbi:MAG: efflux RND transporter periplasmic adaptor subunit [Planctomycetales bacterium]|nr:efflux RND transporter periplasmic adaptor subunit [Planctomycetales bacterium]